jgi:hypothetical protein
MENAIMANDWVAGMCNEKSGFLFSHECYHAPSETCTGCQKPIYQEHSHADGSSYLCTSCVKKQKSRGNRTGRSQHSRHDDYNDPYFYSGYYFGYGNHSGFHQRNHDPFDFTEADGQGLASDTGDAFESDMSAS